MAGPFANPPAPRTPGIGEQISLADLLGSVNTGNMTGVGLNAAPVAYQKPRGFLDTIGKIGDVLAAFGGGKMVYNDMLRQSEQDYNQAVKQQQFQNIFSQFVQNPNNPEAFAQVAAQAPDVALKFREALTPKPQAQGSQSDFQAALRMVAELPATDPRRPLVERFLNNQLAPKERQPTGSDFQIVETPRGYERINRLTGETQPLGIAPPPRATGGTAPSGARPFTQEDYARYGIDPSVPMQFNAKGEAKPVGGTSSVDNAARGGLSATDAYKVRQRLAMVPSIRQSYETVRAAAERLIAAGYNGPVAGRIPPEFVPLADQFESAVAQLRSQARGLTKVAGEGSISDFETKLNNATFPGRTQTAAGIRQSLNGIGSLLDSTEKSYGALIQPQRPPDGIARPRPGQAAPITATGPNGQKLMLQNGAWVPVR